MTISLPLAYLGLDPAPVWRAFALLNSIPRPSGREDAVREAIFSLARERGLETRLDARGNCCVLVPACGGLPTAPPVALQSHLDMVCQKKPDSSFDFERDAIAPRRVDDKIFASNTTLGADNGIGVAFMIALLEGEAPVHPPLELLFTVEEETGLYGAAHLDPILVSSRRLINLDSEEDDEITIGCAGGAGVFIHLPVEREPFPGARVVHRVVVSGLAGGHSGIQIGQPLGNALKLMGQILDALTEAAPGLRLVSFNGGTAHNAIPRDCDVTFVAPSERSEALSSAWTRITDELKSKWSEHESGVALELTGAPEFDGHAMTEKSTQIVLGLVRELPHGVQKMSERWEGKVQTSSNLAEIHTRDGEVAFGVSNRSFLAGDIRQLQERCASLGKNVGARVEERDGYPGWEPRANSPLRDQTAAAFANVSGHLPHIEVVHAGLECGLLSEKLEGLDAVSFGPTIRGAHTPEEWVSIPSVERNWMVLRELLASLARA
jgi:dipeptidase D